MSETTVLSATAGARSLSVKERAPEVARPEVTTADVLHRAADLLEEFGWCQWVPARDESGNECSPYPELGDAVSFCLTGAWERAMLDLAGIRPRYGGTPEKFKLSKAQTAVLRAHGAQNSPVWNNKPGRTKAEVVALLREAARA